MTTRPLAHPPHHPATAHIPTTYGHTGWQNQAACSGCDTEAWFTGSDHVGSATARAICASCPVRAECLALALHTEQGLSAATRFGLYGGHSPAQRAALDPTAGTRKPPGRPRRR